jgi:hypothetical protein
MLIREKDGFYAGQIREFPSHVALELIAAGRAENPFAEPETPPQPKPRVRAAQSSKPSGGKSR